MRSCLLALVVGLGAGLAADASAQTSRQDSLQYYATPVVGFAYNNGPAFLAGGVVGRRVAVRGDVGIGLYGGDLAYNEFAPFVMVQPVAGVTVPLGDRVLGRVQASGLALAADRDRAFDPEGFGLRVLGVQTEATLSREFPVVGTLRLAPTGGGYAAACTTRNIVERAGESCAEAGVLVGAQVLVEVFGVDAVLPLVVPVRLVGDTDAADLDGAFNLARRAITGGVQIWF